MDKKRVQVPLVCHGHSRPVVDLFYSPVTPDGFFLISASKGKLSLSLSQLKFWGIHSFRLCNYASNRLTHPRSFCMQEII